MEDGRGFKPGAGLGNHPENCPRGRGKRSGKYEKNEFGHSTLDRPLEAPNHRQDRKIPWLRTTE